MILVFPPPQKKKNIFVEPTNIQIVLIDVLHREYQDGIVRIRINHSDRQKFSPPHWMRNRSLAPISIIWGSVNYSIIFWDVPSAITLVAQIQKHYPAVCENLILVNFSSAKTCFGTYFPVCEILPSLLGHLPNTVWALPHSILSQPLRQHNHIV